MFLLRGNHESASQTSKLAMGTRAELLHKYGGEVYDALIDLFQSMPPCATVECGGKRFFCSHGGTFLCVRGRWEWGQGYPEPGILRPRDRTNAPTCTPAQVSRGTFPTSTWCRPTTAWGSSRANSARYVAFFVLTFLAVGGPSLIHGAHSPTAGAVERPALVLLWR